MTIKHIEQLFRLLEIIRWPVVALVAIAVLRPYLTSLMSGAKVKLSIGGQSIETTLPEVKQILEEQTAEWLSAEHLAYLTELQQKGNKQYLSGVDSVAQRAFLRPLRNAGLPFTIPRHSHLGAAEGVELSGLGRLYLRRRQ